MCFLFLFPLLLQPLPVRIVRVIHVFFFYHSSRIFILCFFWHTLCNTWLKNFFYKSRSFLSQYLRLISKNKYLTITAILVIDISPHIFPRHLVKKVDQEDFDYRVVLSALPFNFFIYNPEISLSHSYRAAISLV